MSELVLPDLLEDGATGRLTLPRDPSCVMVQLSGGKDSIAALLKTIEVFGKERVRAAHQIILEDWPGTPEYCQDVCDMLGIPLYLMQGTYYAFRCLTCGHPHLSIFYEEAYCHLCGSRDKQFLSVVDSIHSFIRHRRKWVDSNVRACTGHFKSETWNRWARTHEALLGPHPLVILGERGQESRGRAHLPELRYRRNVRQGWVLEWRPLLSYRRIDSYRALREARIEPHGCYKLQWRGLLRIQHKRWLKQGVAPRVSYPGQWDGLAQVEVLSDQVLDPMIDYLMYECDEAWSGPRLSCMDCFYKSVDELQATYATEAGRQHLEKSMALEREISFTMKPTVWLEQIVEG